MTGKKLPDVKGIGGRGRLTKEAIDSLQVYFGAAIRANSDNLENMRKAVWETFFHKLSTNEKPQHSLYPPKGTGRSHWCKYNNGEKYVQHGLPEAVMDRIKPIYRDLANPNLLKKCHHGKTQNINRSFNSAVWTRVPKTVFVGAKTVKVGVYDTLLSFNDGNISRARVLQQLGLDPGHNTVRQLLDMDMARLKKADSALEDLRKKARKTIRGLKRRKEDNENAEYKVGSF